MHRLKGHAFGNKLPRSQNLVVCVAGIQKSDLWSLVSSANDTLAVSSVFPQCFCDNSQQSSEAFLLKGLVNIFQRACLWLNLRKQRISSPTCFLVSMTLSYREGQLAPSRPANCPQRAEITPCIGTKIAEDSQVPGYPAHHVQCNSHVGHQYLSSDWRAQQNCFRAMLPE